MLILIYEKGRVPKKKGRGEHPAISLGRSLKNAQRARACVRARDHVCACYGSMSVVQSIIELESRPRDRCSYLYYVHVHIII